MMYRISEERAKFSLLRQVFYVPPHGAAVSPWFMYSPGSPLKSALSLRDVRRQGVETPRGLRMESGRRARSLERQLLISPGGHDCSSVSVPSRLRRRSANRMNFLRGRALMSSSVRLCMAVLLSRGGSLEPGLKNFEAELPHRNYQEILITLAEQPLWI